MIWLRGWLQQASAEGPRCADGSLFRDIRLSRQDCQRERYIEPIYPGCEAEMIKDSPSGSSSCKLCAKKVIPELQKINYKPK